MADADFVRATVDVIAKRAGNHCSNPDCGVLTSGPAETEDRAILIGEAAHIFGARDGAARFSEKMSDQERSDITNAIWLCRNCHKIVDADPQRFPADILFEWRRLHEAEITRRLGKPGDAIRQKILDRQLGEFRSCSYLAQQIVIDKPEFWEFKLTVELLRTKLEPALSRWDALSRGLYSKPTEIVSFEQANDWLRARMDEIQRLFSAFTALAAGELKAS